MVKAKKIVLLFLLVLYTSYYVSTSFFFHTHKYTWGTVFHSHVHKDSHHNTKSGGHTKQNVIFIDQISHFEYIDFSCNSLLIPLQLQIPQNKFVETTHWVSSIYFKNLSLRAPPIELLVL